MLIQFDENTVAYHAVIVSLYKMMLLIVLWCGYFCVTVISLSPSSLCTTPNGETASCTLLFKCPILVAAAARGDDVVTEFLQASACGTQNFMVCCGTAGNFTNRQTPTASSTKSNETRGLSKEEAKKLLPDRVYCGLQHTDDYFYNKTETSVDEFPWMVYIPTKTYIHDYFLRVESNCVGVLISKRYVLTRKNCSSEAVMIGQHYIYKDVSCIETPSDIDDCINPLLHEFVDDYISSETHNIALLRLKKKVIFSDFVRPICLLMGEDEKPKAGDIVITSGWGEEQFTQGKNRKIKKRIKHTLLSKEECENGNPVSNPICGERLPNSTSYVCPGDTGGALMYRYTTTKNLNWVALGIIAAGTTCAKHQPVVAERITPEIIDWILNNIKP